MLEVGPLNCNTLTTCATLDERCARPPFQFAKRWLVIGEISRAGAERARAWAGICHDVMGPHEYPREGAKFPIRYARHNSSGIDFPRAVCHSVLSSAIASGSERGVSVACHQLTRPQLLLIMPDLADVRGKSGGTQEYPYHSAVLPPGEIGRALPSGSGTKVEGQFYRTIFGPLYTNPWVPDPPSLCSSTALRSAYATVQWVPLSMQRVGAWTEAL